MGRVTLYIAVSLDGFIADRDGGVHWLAPFDSAEYGYDAFVAGMDCLIMGRKTYNQVLGFGPWPYAGKRVVVMSRHRLPDGAPDGVESWHGDDVAALLDRLPGQIWLVGGAQAIGAFLRAGRVDRLRLFVIPRLLGGGIRLFCGDEMAAMPPLRGVRHYSTGVAELDYGTTAP